MRAGRPPGARLRARSGGENPIEGEQDGLGVVYVRDERAGGLCFTLTPLDAIDATDSHATCRGSYVVKLDNEPMLYADGAKIGYIQ